MAFEYITLQRGSSIIRGVLQDVYGDGVLKYETRERERERDGPFAGSIQSALLPIKRRSSHCPRI